MKLSIKQNDSLLVIQESEQNELQLSFYFTDYNGQPDSEDFYITKEQLLKLFTNG
jgi:hypothetical protein